MRSFDGNRPYLCSRIVFSFTFTSYTSAFVPGIVVLFLPRTRPQEQFVSLCRAREHELFEAEKKIGMKAKIGETYETNANGWQKLNLRLRETDRERRTEILGVCLNSSDSIAEQRAVTHLFYNNLSNKLHKLHLHFAVCRCSGQPSCQLHIDVISLLVHTMYSSFTYMRMWCLNQNTGFAFTSPRVQRDKSIGLPFDCDWNGANDACRKFLKCVSTTNDEGKLR